MLRNFLKNRKAQNTAEYALLIALVVAGVIAMQTYAQRALQARIHAAASYMAGNGTTLTNDTQYEPYYLNSSYNSQSNSSDAKLLDANMVASESASNSSRMGGSNSIYNASSNTL